MEISGSSGQGGGYPATVSARFRTSRYSGGQQPRASGFGRSVADVSATGGRVKGQWLFEQKCPNTARCLVGEKSKSTTPEKKREINTYFFRIAQEKKFLQGKSALAVRTFQPSKSMGNVRVFLLRGLSGFGKSWLFNNVMSTELENNGFRTVRIGIADVIRRKVSRELSCDMSKEETDSAIRNYLKNNTIFRCKKDIESLRQKTENKARSVLLLPMIDKKLKERSVSDINKCQSEIDKAKKRLDAQRSFLQSKEMSTELLEDALLLWNHYSDFLAKSSAKAGDGAANEKDQAKIQCMETIREMRRRIRDKSWFAIEEFFRREIINNTVEGISKKRNECRVLIEALSGAYKTWKFVEYEQVELGCRVELMEKVQAGLCENKVVSLTRLHKEAAKMLSTELQAVAKGEKVALVLDNSHVEQWSMNIHITRALEGGVNPDNIQMLEVNPLKNSKLTDSLVSSGFTLKEPEQWPVIPLYKKGRRVDAKEAEKQFLKALEQLSILDDLERRYMKQKLAEYNDSCRSMSVDDCILASQASVLSDLQEKQQIQIGSGNPGQQQQKKVK